MNRKITFFITLGLLYSFTGFTIVRSMEVTCFQEPEPSQDALFSAFLGMLPTDSKRNKVAIQCTLNEVAKELFPELKMLLQSAPPESETKVTMEMRTIFDSSGTLHVIAVPSPNALKNCDALNDIEKKGGEKKRCKNGIHLQKQICKKQKKRKPSAKGNQEDYQCLVKFVK